MSYNYVEIGEIIKKKRLELGRDLPALAEETKIFEKYLIAIESGDLREFPSMVYYKLFAGSYAKELGLDPDTLFTPEVETEESPAPSGTPNNKEAAPATISMNASIETKKSGLRNLVWVLIIIILGGAATTYILIKGKESQETSQASVPGPTVTKTEEEEGIPAFDTMAIDSTLAGNLPVQTMRLNILVKETCWMVVVADGDTVIFGNLNPGSSHDFRAINYFDLSAGNPRGLEIRLNDTLLRPLSSHGLPFKSLQINRDNAHSFYLLPEDSTHAGD